MSEGDLPKRRDILKRIGATGVGLAGISASASANPTEQREITLLDGGEKYRIAGQIRGTKPFRELRRKARDIGGGDGAPVDSSGILVGRRRTEEMAREVVQYPLRSVEDASYAAIVVGRQVDTREIQFAWLDYYYEAADGILSEVHRIEHPVGEGTTTRNPTAATLESSDDTQNGTGTSELSKRVLDVDDDLVRDATTRELADDGSGGVTTQSVPDDLCDWCNYAVGTVCTTGCGAVGGFTCGFFGITVPIAGVSCLTFVTIVCEAADRYSGCGAAVANYVCDDQFDVC